MTNAQFRFSFLAGLALAALGGLIASKAAVGLSLLGVGAGIAALSLFTRGTQGNETHPLAMPEPVARVQEAATE